MPKSKKLSSYPPDKEEANEPVMYILVNSDLQKKMNKGKIATQCCHAVCEVIWHLESNSNSVYQDWKQFSQAKLVKKAPEELMINIMSQCRDRSNRLSATGDPFWAAQVRDAGRTQVDPHSLTALAFCPIQKRYTPEWLAQLPLL